MSNTPFPPLAIHAKILLEKQGQFTQNLPIPQGHFPRFDMQTTAEIKHKLLCRVVYNGEFHYHTDRIKLFLVQGGTETQLGEFIIASSKCISTNGIPEYELTCYDLTALCKRRVAARPFFPKGSLYTTAVRQLLTAAGITRMNIEESPLTFATDREDWEPGTSRLTIINQLLKEMSYHSLFCGSDGIVRAKNYTHPSVENITLRYNANTSYGIIIPGHTIEVDAFEHPNMFFYTCENPELAQPLYATAVNDDATNPFSIQNQGEVPIFVRVNNAASQEALQRMAETHRLKSMLSADAVCFETTLIPHGVFEIIGLQTGTFDGILAETAWSMELAPSGVMKHYGRQICYM